MFVKSIILPFPRVLLLPAILLVALVLGAGLAQGTAADTGSDFSTFYGGSNEECLFERCAITQDADGNLIIAGTTRSQDFPTVNEIMTDTADGSADDIFLVKMTPDGQTVLFSTYLGNGRARDVVVDGNGDIVLAGSTADRAFAVTPDAVQDCDRLGNSALVMKVSGDGQSILYASCLGGNGATEAFGVDVDGGNNIAVVGYTQAPDFPTLNPYQPVKSVEQDAFISKINATSGQLVFSTFLGGEDRDRAYDVSVDAAGNIYGGGGTRDQATFPQTPGTVGPDTDRGGAIVFSFSPTGQMRYSTALGSVTHEAPMVHADDDGYLTFLWNNYDGVGRLNQDASAFVYRARVDDFEISEGGNYGGMDVDEDGNAYIIGRMNQPGARKDIAIAAIHASGRVVFYDTIGGALDDTGYGITVRRLPDGSVTAAYTGVTASANFPLIKPLQNSLKGTTDLAIFNVTGLEAYVDQTFIYLPFVTGR